jgi:hypothetical protein
MAVPRVYVLSGIVALFAAIALGFTVFSALGSDDGNHKDFEQSSDPSSNIPADQLREVNVVLAGSDFAVGRNNFVFGITDGKDEPQGGATAVATFYDIRDSKNPKPIATVNAVQSAPGVGQIVEHVHGNGEVHKHGGEDDNRVGYYAPVDFPFAGYWGVSVDVTLKDGTKGTSNLAFNVAPKHRFPAPGEAAPKSDNLTKADVRDIKEIDSGDPPNDMHDVKIKDAIAAHRPLVVVFATPAFCTSRFCGPVTEEVEDLQEDYRGQVDFVHVEVWRNFDTKELNPTMKEWLVQPDGSYSEPIVYVVDKNGVIYDRWEGPVARNIMEASVKAVANGTTYGQ